MAPGRAGGLASHRVRAEADWILRQGRQSPAFQITEEHLVRLPEPVQGHLRSIGILGKQSIRTVWLKQRGSLFLNGKWLPFRAEQCFATNPPGFVWQARIQFLPLLNFSVTDMFVDGRGRQERNRVVLMPWSGRCSDYREAAGLAIPFRATATWHLESGDQEYFRGELTGIRFDT